MFANLRRTLFESRSLAGARRIDAFGVPGSALVRRDALDRLYRGAMRAHDEGKLPRVHGGVIAHVAWFHIAMGELEELEQLIDGVLSGDGDAVTLLREQLRGATALSLNHGKPFPDPQHHGAPCGFRHLDPFNAVAAAVIIDRLEGVQGNGTVERMLGYYLARAAPIGAALQAGDRLAQREMGLDEFAATLLDVGRIPGGHKETLEVGDLHGRPGPLPPPGGGGSPLPDPKKWDPCTLNWGHCAFIGGSVGGTSVQVEDIPVLIGSANPEAVCHGSAATITLYPLAGTTFPATQPTTSTGGLVLYDGTTEYPLYPIPSHTTPSWSAASITVGLPAAALPGCATIFWKSPNTAGSHIADAAGDDCANLFPRKPPVNTPVKPLLIIPGRIKFPIVSAPVLTFVTGGSAVVTAQACTPITLEWKISAGMCGGNAAVYQANPPGGAPLNTPTGSYALVSLTANGQGVFTQVPLEGKLTVTDAASVTYTLTVQTFAGQTQCGTATKSVVVTRTSLISLLAPDRVYRVGRKVPVTVRIPCAATPGGVQVALTSSVPGSLPHGAALIPAGQREVVVELTVAGNNFAKVQLTGSAPGYQNGVTTVLVGPTSCLPNGMVADPRRYGGEWKIETTLTQVVGIHMAVLHTGKVLLFSYREGLIAGSGGGAVMRCIKAIEPALKACDTTWRNARTSCTTSRNAAITACDSTFACATASQCGSVNCPPCTGGGPARWACDIGRAFCLLVCNTGRLLCEAARGICKAAAWVAYGICDAVAWVSMAACKTAVILGTPVCVLISGGQAFRDWLLGIAPPPDEVEYNIAHASRGSCVLWDPKTNTSQNVPIGRNLFCSGHAFLPDGRLLVASGQFPAPLLDGVDLLSPLAGRGAAFDLNVFDPVTESWTRLPDMAEGRWYPTVVTMADGRVLVMSGTNGVFANRGGTRSSIEIFGVTETSPPTLIRGPFEPLPGQPVADPKQTYPDGTCYPWFFYHLYPFGHVLPNRDVFVHWKRQTADYSYSALRWNDHWTGPLFASCKQWKHTKYEISRTGEGPGTSVILPFKPAKDISGAVSYPAARIMILGGGGAEGPSSPPVPKPGVCLSDPTRPECLTLDNTTAATKTSEILDYGVPDVWGIPDWRWTGKDQAQPSFMNHERVMPDTVLLPDGQVLVVNGAKQGMAGGFLVHLGPPLSATPALAAELFDPDSETWDELCQTSVERRYHATALLLPDARVVVAGHDGFLNNSPPPGNVSRYEIEVFSPPYLFRGPRPVITSAPTRVAYGSAFTIGVDDASKIGSVALLRGASVTHVTNTDQRYVGLAINSIGAGTTLSLQAPPDGGIAPPGYYMLFVVSKDGVPSEARWVRVP